MTAEQAINMIHSFIRKGAKPGLERITELLDRIGHPERGLKFVHIAGTNGKGSTAAMTASILTQAGYCTGLFTSPFIYRFHERMQIDGVQISDEDLAAATEAVLPHAQAMEEPPTEFELVCAVAFTYFTRQNCRIVVLECGMGGSLDATNVIPVPEVAVITNIGLDHTEQLGPTLECIAAAKSGIIKEGGRVVLYRGGPEVEQVFEKACRLKHAKLHKAAFERLRLKTHSLEGQAFDCGDWHDLQLPLLGDHQLHNAAVVLGVVEQLRDAGWSISEEAVRRGLSKVSWPGRFDIAGRNPLFVIDGGHNPQCIDALVKNIQDYLAGKRIIVLTGVLADKDYGDMFRPVMAYAERFVCITPPSPRRLEAAQLAAHLRCAGADAAPCGSIEEGVCTAIRLAGKDGVVLCFGSLYSIGAIRDALAHQ